MSNRDSTQKESAKLKETAQQKETDQKKVDAKEAGTLYRHAGVVTFFTLLSRVLGMTRDLVISNRFGASGQTDAWVQAFRIPNALRRLTAEGSMTIAFVPIYVKVREQEGVAAAHLFSRRVLGLVLLGTLVLSGVGVVLAEPLTMLFSPGFADDPEKFSLTASILRWTFPYLLLVSLVAWAMGVLNSEGTFGPPAAAPILLNVGIILSVLLLAKRLVRPVMAIAAGVLVGGVAQVLLQIPSLAAKGLKAIPLAGWRDVHVRELFGLLVPSLFGVAVYEINIIILGVLASFLPTGQIFHYHNATRLTELVMGVFAFAFTTAGLPRLSEHRARGDWDQMGRTLRLTFSAVFFTILPAMAGLMAAAPAVVAMLYLHGAYTLADVSSTAATLQWLAVGMPAVAGVRVMVPAFYALGDARTPVKVSAVTLMVTAALGWQLSQWFEVRGLALGLSLGTWFQCLVLWVALRRKGAQMGQWMPWKPVLVQIAAATGAATFAGWVVSLSNWQGGAMVLYNWGVFTSAVFGAVGCYLIVTLAFKDEQARHWITLFVKILAKVGLRR